MKKKKRKFDTDAAASSSKYVLSSPTTRNEGQDEELELLRLDFAFKLNEEEIVDENLRYLATDARLKQTYHRSKEKETPRHTQPYVGPRVQNLSASCEPYNDRVCPFDEGEIHTGPRLSTWFEHFFGFHASQDGIHTTRPRAPLPIVSDRVVHLGTLS
ncbi:hypothetical protein BDN72DRAFT_458644 [Pluteus cervinus]|uniref:Uncharacterized protein n=1 Tax=Pluteus cervinus TaxID=181527 RepID=A0ACD3B088_9AGAR|nr:hypothetical protein BDN72DRAFT_458644 [Pluteus cervinus]